MQLQNDGMNCRCTLDRPPHRLISKLFLKRISFLWLLTLRRLLILCAQKLYLGWTVYLLIYYVLLCFFYCKALWKPLCLFKLCFINKMSWIGLEILTGIMPVCPCALCICVHVALTACCVQHPQISTEECELSRAPLPVIVPSLFLTSHH